MAANLLLAFNSKAIKVILYIFLIVITLKHANSTRILIDDGDDDSLPPAPQPSNQVTTPVANAAPAVGPTATTPAPTATSAAVAGPTLSFFMHDILAGAAPSGRVVSGIIASTQISGLPFSKKNGGVFPINGGVPLVTANNGIINNNGMTNNRNRPFIAGLNGATASTVINSNGNNLEANGNSLPFVSGGQLPQGAALQKLIFGTITVIDDELTEGHELGASIIGKAQGFHLASSLDGSSQTMAFTALFGEHEGDTISFFGVHRTAAHESHVAVVGGTGKYENAQGHATIETLHLTDQHTTDGVETLLQFSVYLTH